MASRLVIMLALLSLFSTFTFSKNLLIEVEDEGAAGEDVDEDASVGEAPVLPPEEANGEDYAPPSGPPPINPGGDFGRK